MERVTPQPLGSRLQKAKRKLYLRSEKCAKILADSSTFTPKQHLKQDSKPLSQCLLEESFYTDLCEKTEDLPRIEIPLSSRKLVVGKRANAQVVSYEEPPSSGQNPLFAFIQEAAKASEHQVRGQMRQAARDQSKKSMAAKRKQAKKSPSQCSRSSKSADGEARGSSQALQGHQENESHSESHQESSYASGSIRRQVQETGEDPCQVNVMPTRKDSLDEPGEWQVYDNSFKQGSERKTQIGPCFQVSSQAIPAAPSFLSCLDEHLARDNERVENYKVWDPDRLSAEQLDFYFDNLRLYWPYDLYKFSEDIALTYLMRKNYDVEMALALIIVNLDDLVDMMRRQDDHLDRTLANYDFRGSKIHHAHLSVRFNETFQLQTADLE